MMRETTALFWAAEATVLGLSVMLMTTCSLPELESWEYLTVKRKVPVRLGVPETTPDADPVKKEGRFSKVKVGVNIPLTLKRTS